MLRKHAHLKTPHFHHIPPWSSRSCTSPDPSSSHSFEVPLGLLLWCRSPLPQSAGAKLLLPTSPGTKPPALPVTTAGHHASDLFHRRAPTLRPTTAGHQPSGPPPPGHQASDLFHRRASRLRPTTAGGRAPSLRLHRCRAARLRPSLSGTPASANSFCHFSALWAVNCYNIPSYLAASA